MFSGKSSLINTSYGRTKEYPLPEFFTLQKLREGNIPLFFLITQNHVLMVLQAHLTDMI